MISSWVLPVSGSGILGSGMEEDSWLGLEDEEDVEEADGLEEDDALDELK